jgi:hypothetical protein
MMMMAEKKIRGIIRVSCAVAALGTLSLTAAPGPALAEPQRGAIMAVAPRTEIPKPSTNPPIPFAKPQITGPAELPLEEQGLPGD